MTDPCSIELLESALAGNLPPHSEAVLDRHLVECEECSAALERMAGGPAWCEETALFLAGDEFDDAVPSRGDYSEVDFSVEHLEPSSEPNALGRLGAYDILEIIGRGGMGVVLKGFDRELKRCVAIKVLAPHLANSCLAKKRFTREAQAAAAIVHPNVMAIHHVQPNGRLPFLVMPLVAGESLAQRLASRGTLGLKETLRIGMQVAAGLGAAHDQGLVHRDVKPANILLEMGIERAVLTDFGLARAGDDVSLSRWGIIAGTPQYMSPEQAKGEPLDGRSDLFSLGCVLYEMATGVSPFRTDSVMATMRRLVEESPQALASLNPELPPWFCTIVDRLMEKEPARRFDSAKELSELLESCLAHLQQPTGMPLPAELASVGRVCGPSEPSARATNASHKKDASTRAKWPRFTKGALIMITTFGVALASFLAFVDPPDIAGEWSGPDWGKIVLKQLQSTEYTGSYTDAIGKQSGELTLNWSRLENRFVGTWREAEDRFGQISLRLDGLEIRGAYTTAPESKIKPGTPRLAEFTWKRSGTGFDPIIEREVDGAIDFESGRLARIPDLEIDASIGELATVAKWMSKNSMDASFDAQSLLAFGMKVAVGTNEDWEKATPSQIADRLLKIHTGVSPSPRLGLGFKGPSTHLIQTREGSVGLVQILGFKDEAKSTLKIRYKLATFLVEVRKFERKGPWASRLVLMPDGKHVIAASGGAIRYLSLDDGKEKITFEPPSLYYNGWGLGLSADGERVIVGGEDPVARIFDTRTGKRIIELNGNAIRVRGAVLLPDGKRAITGSVDQMLRLWDVASGKELRAFDNVPDHVQTLAISPDGKLVAAGLSIAIQEPGVPGRVGIWDVDTGRRLHIMEGHTNRICSLRFSSDGKTLLSSSFDKTARLWDVAQGKLHKTFDHQGRLESAAFTPDGKRFVSVGDQNNPVVIVWDIASGEPLFQSARVGAGFLDVVTLPDDHHCVTCGKDGAIRIWEWKR